MDVHPTKNGIFIGIDPYPYSGDIIWLVVDLPLVGNILLIMVNNNGYYMVN